MVKREGLPEAIWGTRIVMLSVKTRSVMGRAFYRRDLDLVEQTIELFRKDVPLEFQVWFYVSNILGCKKTRA